MWQGGDVTYRIAAARGGAEHPGATGAEGSGEHDARCPYTGGEDAR